MLPVKADLHVIRVSGARVQLSCFSSCRIVPGFCKFRGKSMYSHNFEHNIGIAI